MVAPDIKGVFITRYEAIRNVALMTIIYVAIIFRREIFAWQKGMTVDELFKHASSGIPGVTIASFLYIVFLLGWCNAVYKSYKHYKEKKRGLKLLMEDERS